ncbi:MAG: MarR family winged helix-turn-helix transcriptional regulator [Bacillota bacterium]|jgi:DNA-binding MarR family transcriptional regulator
MENLPDLMEYIAKLARMARRRPLLGKDLSRGGHRLLALVLRNDGMRTTELAEAMDIRPSSLTDALDRLEASGYIRRQRDETDSRIIRIFATGKARDEAAALKKEYESYRQRLNACLTAEEARTFCAICDKLYEFMAQDLDGQTAQGRRRGGKNRGDHWQSKEKLV